MKVVKAGEGFGASSRFPDSNVRLETLRAVIVLASLFNWFSPIGALATPVSLPLLLWAFYTGRSPVLRASAGFLLGLTTMFAVWTVVDLIAGEENEPFIGAIAGLLLAALAVFFMAFKNRSNSQT